MSEPRQPLEGDKPGGKPLTPAERRAAAIRAAGSAPRAGPASAPDSAPPGARGAAAPAAAAAPPPGGTGSPVARPPQPVPQEPSLAGVSSPSMDGSVPPSPPAPPLAADGDGWAADAGDAGSGAADAEPPPTADRSPLGDDMAEEEMVDREVDEAERVLLDDLDRLQTERNEYLDQLLRTKADFENYRKRILKQQTEHLERAAEGLVEKLLDVFDTFDLALRHGEGFEQVHAGLMGVLQKEGLEKIDPAGQPFDPNEADAVAHEDGDDGPVVAEVLRPGYRWKGRVLRPAMVKVRG